jgi:hypothetical protein
MQSRGLRTVLCAGNGISQEPRALAEAGFGVHALDCSVEATNIARSFEFPPHAFEHYCDPGSRRPGGSVEFLVGDIFDGGVCPGPFDVVIERRTAQIYQPPDFDVVLNKLADRLATNGIFVSHCHDGAWKPPAEPTHFTASWFRDNGWTVWREGRGAPPAGRVAWLQMSTG